MNILNKFFTANELDNLPGLLHCAKDGCFRLGKLSFKPKYLENNHLLGFDVIDDLDNDFAESIVIKYIVDVYSFTGLIFTNSFEKVVLKVGTIMIPDFHKYPPQFDQREKCFEFNDHLLISKSDSLINSIT